MNIKTEKLELRGIANKQSDKGNVYYYINVEEENGTPYQFYCASADAFPEGLKKGDKITLTFEYKTYKGQVKLVVTKVDKVA